MRDTPWHARPRAPEPSPATQPAPKQTTFRRLVLVNQELAQHNTKLRRDLADARRRAAVAANAEAQAGIVVAMHRERQAEAARLRRGLLTSLSDAREEIRKLKIQVDAQASLLRLQRALDTSPANRSTNQQLASPAASTTRREPPPPEAAKKTPSKPPSPEPRSPVRGVSNTLGLVPPVSKHISSVSAHEKKSSPSRDDDACVSQSRENEKTQPASTTPPPRDAPRRPRVNLRGFAARETTSPGTTSGGLGCRRLEPPSSPPFTAATPRRTLRYRHKAVVYTEPSLKTKMRRPRTPPPAARAPAPAAVAVEANPVFPKPSPETVSAADDAAADDAEDERLLGPSLDDAASSEEEETSTTPLAFVTSRRHRRRRAVAPFDS